MKCRVAWCAGESPEFVQRDRCGGVLQAKSQKNFKKFFGCAHGVSTALREARLRMLRLASPAMCAALRRRRAIVLPC